MHNLYTLAMPTQRTRAFVAKREKLASRLHQSMLAARCAAVLLVLMLVLMLYTISTSGTTPWNNPEGFMPTSIIGFFSFIVWGYSMIQFMTIESAAMIEDTPIRGWHFMSPRNFKKRNY
jgi:hypothetical protein